MHLFFNTYYFTHQEYDTALSNDKAAAFDIIQNNNSEALLQCLNKRVNIFYNKSNNECSYSSIPDTIKMVKRMFSDYIDKSKTDYPSSTVELLLAIRTWEDEFHKVITKLSSNQFQSIFTRILLSQVRELVLIEKLPIIQNFSDKNYYSFIEKIKKIYQVNYSLLNNPKNIQKGLDSIKRSINNGNKNNLRERLRRILECEKILLKYTYPSTHLPNPMEQLEFNFNYGIYKGLCDYEKTVLLCLVEEIKAKNKKRVRTPRSKTFDSFLVDSDNKEKILEMLHKHMKGKNGKQVTMIIRSAYAAGITNIERIPYTSVKNEFGEIGATSGYYYYFDNDYLPVDTLFNITEKLKEEIRTINGGSKQH